MNLFAPNISRNLLWHWNWRLTAQEMSAQLDIKSDAVHVNLSAANIEDLERAWKDVCEQSHSAKLRMRIDSQTVWLQGTSSLDGATFRAFYQHVAKIVGCDCGLVMHADYLGEPYLKISAWPSWRMRWDRVAISSLEFRDYRKKANEYAAMDTWMQSFQSLANSATSSTTGSTAGWIAGVGLPQKGIARLELPKQRAWRAKGCRFAFVVLCVMACGIMGAGIYGYKNHLGSKKALVQQGSANNTTVENSWLDELSTQITMWQSARDSLLQKGLRLPPGFKTSRDIERMDSIQDEWNQHIQQRAMQELYAQMQRCDLGLDAYCEVLQSSRRFAWLWIGGVSIPQNKLHKAWKGMLAEVEIPWTSAWELWIERAYWKRLNISKDSALTETWVQQANRFEHTLQNFITDRADSVWTKADSLLLPHAKQNGFMVPRFALLEAQEGIEDVFRYAEDSSVQTNFRKKLQEQQWDWWQQKLIPWIDGVDSVTPMQLDSMRNAWFEMQKSLGLAPTQQDSLRLNLALARTQDRMLANHVQYGLARVWPLVCDMNLPDASPVEMSRIYGVGGELEQWMLNTKIPVNPTRQMDHLRGVLFDAQGFKVHHLQWKVCSVQSWDVRLELDSIRVQFDGKKDTCVQGIMEWPTRPRLIRVFAKHGEVEWEYHAQGAFALQRFIKTFGTWHAGQGLLMDIPLRARDFQARLKIQWQEQGDDASVIKPCGFAFSIVDK